MVYSIGETTYDIIFKEDVPIAGKVGGSQLNTSVSLGRLNVPVSFLTHFGTDRVGDIALEFLEQNGINTDFIVRHNKHSNIALAFLDQNNNADYNFLKPDTAPEIPVPKVVEGDMVSFGSFFALKKDNRPRLKAILSSAAKAGAIVFYDPNFRKPHLKDLPGLKPVLMENFESAQIIRGSDEDFECIFGTDDIGEIYSLLSPNQQKVLVLTQNKNGVLLKTPAFSKFYPVSSIKPVSTIGAGDNFNAGIIYGLFSLGVKSNFLLNLGEAQWDKIIHYSMQFSQDVCMSWENYISEKTVAEFNLKNL